VLPRLPRIPLFVLLGAAAVLVATACQPTRFTEMVPMRDAVRLSTTVHLPVGPGPWPTLVYRTPYGKDEFAESAEAYAKIGVAVVYQDMRGRFDSEGVDGVFTTDGDGPLKDGYDTLSWAVAQDWCNGRIGTLGGSARGIVQYMQASAAPPGLMVMNPEVATPNLYEDGLFYGGAFRYALAVNWLSGQGSVPFLDRVAEHPYEDEFWDPVQTRDRFGDATAAGLHVGGWFDIFQQGTLDGFAGYQAQGGPGAAGNQKLIMGPWTHNGMRGREQGELLFPENAERPPYPYAFDTLFNHYLQVNDPGVTDTPDDVPNVQYYVMGDVDDPGAPGNAWRTAEAWPPESAAVRLHLQPGGLLTEDCPPAAGGVTSYVSDPSDPVPTVCGNNMTIPDGPCDQGVVEARDDVAVFTTGVLAGPVEITGRVKAHLFVDIDRPDADLMVRMTDVYPDGRSMLIADGAARLAARGTTTGLDPLSPGEVVEAVVDLWSTSIVLNTGHRLRISVSSSNSPRFAVNQNNGLDYPAYILIPGAPVTVRIHHNPDAPSYLEVPEPARPPGDFNACGG